jgi:hypothetical protein
MPDESLESNGSPELLIQQQSVCVRFGVDVFESPEDLNVGVDPQVREGVTPLNGLRHFPEDGTTGWFIWAGEVFSSDPEFFQPLHVQHLVDWCPDVLPYLGLPPGWRFLIAPGHEDVWFDQTLLDVEQ